MTVHSYNTNNATAGKPGLAFSAALMLIMAAISFHTLPGTRLEGELGLCFPSPNIWAIPAGLSWGINIILLLITATAAIFLNKQYNFLQTPTLFHASAFLVMTGANPWITKMLCTSTIVVAVIMVCTWILFSLYDRRNATAGIFCIFSILSWGSTFQYSMLMFAPVFVAGGVFMKAFRVKETIAALMGLAAPYWALLGLGIIDPAQLQLPTFTNLFHSFVPPAGLLGLLILTGGTILIGTMSGLSNAFHGEWGNSRNLAFNKFINLLGFASAMFAIIDNNNMLAYCATINLCMAIQGAKMLNRSRNIRAGLVYTLFCALYITAFIFIIYV